MQISERSAVKMLDCEYVADVLLSDDDYTGYAINPITHPLAIIGAVGTYAGVCGAANCCHSVSHTHGQIPVDLCTCSAAMMKYRFPISATVKVAKLKVQDRDVDVRLSTLTRRVEDNRVTTTKFTGAMLSITI